MKRLGKRLVFVFNAIVKPKWHFPSLFKHTPGFGMMGASAVGDASTPRGRGRGGRGRGRGRGFNNGGGYGQGGKTQFGNKGWPAFCGKRK